MKSNKNVTEYYFKDEMAWLVGASYVFLRLVCLEVVVDILAVRHSGDIDDAPGVRPKSASDCRNYYCGFKE